MVSPPATYDTRAKSDTGSKLGKTVDPRRPRSEANRAAILRDVAFGANGLKLDVYKSYPENSQSPIILFLYGGAWRLGFRRLYRFIGEAFSDRGYTTVIPDYRVFPNVRFPKFVEDAADAYAWVTTEFPQQQIILMGHSAGAHIAALLALDRHYLSKLPPPVAFVGLAGPYAIDPTSWFATRAIFSGGSPGSTQPLTLVAPGAPPMLLIQGSDDRPVKLSNLTKMATAVRNAGTPVETFVADGIGHLGVLFALAPALRWRTPIFERIITFLEKDRVGCH